MSAEPDLERLRGQLAQWRAGGRANPLHLATLEALARRADGQRGLARRRLGQRLAQLVEAHAATLAAPVAAADAQAPVAAPGPLAAVTARLGELALARHGATSAGAQPEMAMLGELRRLWAQVRSESQLRRSLQDLPEDAGPLNSGKLVYRALNQMGELSPQYLRHFLAHLDALAWIAQVPAPAAAATASGETPAPRKRTRRRKQDPG